MEQAAAENEESRRVNAAMMSLAPEFPGQGVVVVVQDGLGRFTMSSNIHTTGTSGLLRHIADHLDGRCKCG